MLTLRTLGGLALVTDGGALGGLAAQRRPMALLAVLAAAGEASVTRERLAGLLWPDADPERARRSVAQAVYTIRRATGLEQLVLGSTALQLNAALVASDLGEFRAALAERRLEAAVAAFRGEFLEGFHVPGAVEFERWVEAERARVRRDYAGALDQLARQAEAADDLAGAVRLRQRAAALDPLDSSATLALVDALARAGDVAGALRAARVHEALLAEQLELAPPAALTARVAALQAAPPTPAAPSTMPDVAERPVPDVARPIAVAAAPDVDRADAPSARPARRRAWRGPAFRASAALVGGLALLSIGVLYGRGLSPDAAARAIAPAPPALRPDVVAVLPFAADSVEASLRELGEGVADAVARSLGEDDGARAIDPATVFAAAGRLGRGGGTAREIGRAVGAGQVVVGRVVGGAGRLTLSAALVDVATGVQRDVWPVHGPLDSLPVLIARLAARVVAGHDLGSERAGSLAAVSLPVLRTYLRAEAAVRDDRVDDAVRLYQRALDDDSTFVLAALGLADAADRFNAAEQHDRGLALAWAGRDRLQGRDRALLLALAGPRYPEPSPAAEQLAAWEHAVALAPDRASAWNELGERLLHDGRVLGLRSPEARADAAFGRALALDAEYAPALRNRIELAALRADTARLRRIGAPDRVRAVGGELTGYYLWRVATVRGDSAALAALRARLPSLGAPSLRAIAMAAQHTGLGREDGERALRVLAARAALAAEQLDVLLAEHSLALGQGLPVRALDVTERLQDAQPWSRAHLRLRVLDALYAGGDSSAAVAAVGLLARSADGAPERRPEARALQLADRCVVAQWRVAAFATGATGGAPDPATVRQVRAAIDVLRRGELPRVVVLVGVTPPACAEILEAQLAVALRAPDARRRVDRLDALMLTGPAIGDARTYANLVVARLYARLGEPQRALAAVRQRAYLRGWPRYLASSLREEAALALAAGDRTGATSAADRLLALRAEPAPPDRVDGQ